MGKTLIIIGLLFIVAGVLVSILPGGSLPRLPGDIHVRGESYSFYFPLGWSDEMDSSRLYSASRCAILILTVSITLTVYNEEEPMP